MNFSFLYQLNFKKIVVIILFLLLCFGLAFGIYWMFFRSEEPGPGEPGYVGPGGQLPGTGTGTGTVAEPGGGALPDTGEKETGVEEEPDAVAQGGNTQSLPVTGDKVLGVVLATDGRGVSFYNQNDNKFYTFSERDEQLVPLSNQEFFEVESVAWSRDNSLAVIGYPDGSKILYDFSKNRQLSLSKQISEPVFSDQDEIVYKYLSEDGENNWLAVTRPDGSQNELIQPLGDQEGLVQVTWSPTHEVVALYAKPIGVDKSEVFFIGLQGENNLSLEVAGENFKGLWSPTGKRILYQVVSSDNNYNPSLWVTDVALDAIGRNKYNLGLSTWVDKCVFAVETVVYCAVPRELPEGAGLYPDLIETTQDLIYKIDLTTGLKNLVANPVLENENNFRIDSLKISSDGTILYFWDKNSEQVYKIYLK